MASSTHYALVNAGSNPVIVPDNERDDPRRELSQLYQQYAEMYPNPRLVEEYRMKNELLQATSAVASAQIPAPARNRGLFARMFGGGATKNQQVSSPRTPEIPLVYYDIPNEDDDGSMCGTQESLDRSCIPLEACSVARFHLTSQATRGNHPNTVRWGPLLGRSVPTSLVVVGLGLIAELHPDKASTILSTSDRAALLDYSRVDSAEFRVEYVRACGISPNCIAVSWGFLDGMVGIYRRIHFPEDERCGWEQLWLVRPSSAVLEANRDVFHDDEAHPSSPLLRVADLLPLRVMTGDRGRPMVATLAIARLGCHLELLPIPTDLWFGPLLTPENHKRPRTPKRNPGQHYSFGKYIGSPTVALTTEQHHLDILSMDAMRTTVGVETVWNQQAYPGGPPSEFIVALSGLSRQSPGYECITFWTVCTLFTNEPRAENQGHVGFELHSTFLQSTLYSSGAEVSIFATPEIMQHWRRPRRVELRLDASVAEESFENAHTAKTEQVTTISTPAPVISMQFLDQKGLNLLAIMDWNGGTTLFDCAPMERTAAQSLSWAELARLELAAEEGRPIPPMLRVLVSRSQFSRAIGQRNKISALQWLKVVASETGNNDEDSYSLALLLRNDKKLLILTFYFRSENCQEVDEPQSSIVSLPFPGDGATMGDLGHGNLLFVAKAKEKVGSCKLKCFVMQSLRPTAIVESLVREGKYEEAISATKSLHQLDQDTLIDVVEECHRHLWETKRDIDNLADTRNVSYIVTQAVSICESPSDDIMEMPFDKLRLLCQLATAMGRNYEPVQDAITKLGSFLIRLGTYELLSGCCAASPDPRTFFSEFQRVSVSDLAIRLAERGDITALSVVIFRHRSELLASIFDIFSSIPPTTDLQTFIHLVPLLKNGRVTDTFIPSTAEFTELHMSQLPQHLKNLTGVRLVMDSSDERLVLARNALNETEACSFISIKQAARWFEFRSTNVQDFVGDLQSVIRTCEVGMWCGGFDFKKSKAPESDLHQLFKTWRGAKLLHRILLDDCLALDSSDESNVPSTLVVRINDLLSMELPALIDFILRGASDSTRICSRCIDYLQPLLLVLNRDDTMGTGAGFDLALSSYCSRLIGDCLALATHDPNDERLPALASKAVGTCAAIATTSSSSLRKQDRLLKDARVLIDMVITVMYEMSSVLGMIDIQPMEKEFVEAIWTMYEALPDQAPASMPHGESLLPLLHRLDNLRLHLTCVDILAMWPGSKPFSFLAKRLRDGSEFDEHAGIEVVERLCGLFTSNLRVLRTKEKQSMLLQDLLSDVQQVNISCCQNSLDLPHLLSRNIVVSLLTTEHFVLMVEYCRFDSSLVDHEQVLRIVLSFVEDAIFSDDDDGNRVKAAMKCLDFVGPAFPDIQPGFAEIQRYLDAAYFIAAVIYEGRPTQAIRPIDLRKQSPLDAIESIVRDKPESVFCGCPQWQDAMYAVTANETLRVAFNSGRVNAEPLDGMPVLPGGAIFHLATLLGLEDEHPALVVKSRVIHYCISIGLHGAAAAVCRTLLGGHASEVDDEAAGLAKLGSVAQIVCDNNYADLETKHELCRLALINFSGRLDISNTSVFAAIAATSTSLDHQRSRHNRNVLGPNQEHGKLLSRPVSRLQQHILAEYNADIHGLFSDLMSQTSTGTVHDSLMNALSRFVIYWCVSDSKMLRPRLVMREKNDARENWALGCSLILHIPSKLTAANCAHELQKIAADQASTVASEARFGNDSICVPSQDIVTRMIHRGYNEKAARRAVFMTQNAGYDEALGWAFAHLHDPDFNEPILVVRDRNQLFIDEDSIQRLQKSLDATQSLVGDDVGMERLRSLLMRQNSDLFVSGTHASLQASAIVPVPQDLSETHTSKVNHPTPVKRISQLRVKPPQPKHLSVAPSPSKPSGEVSSSQGRSQPDTTRPQASKPTLRPIESTKASPHPIASMYQSRLSRNGVSQGSASKPGSTADAKFPSRLASPRDGDEARMALLKRGQEALSKRRTHGEVPDRLKLIENGRELLKKSLATTKSGPEVAPIRTVKPLPSLSVHAESTQASSTSHLAASLNGDTAEVKETADNTSDEGSAGWDFDNFDDI